MNDTPLTDEEKRKRNVEYQRRFRDKHRPELKDLRKRYLENTFRRKFGLEVKP